MPFQPFADGRLPLDEVPAANGRTPVEDDEQADCVVCGDQGTEAYPVEVFFDWEDRDDWVAAHEDCADGEGYRRDRP